MDKKEVENGDVITLTHDERLSGRYGRPVIIGMASDGVSVGVVGTERGKTCDMDMLEAEEVLAILKEETTWVVDTQKDFPAGVSGYAVIEAEVSKTSEEAEDTDDDASSEDASDEKPLRTTVLGSIQMYPGRMPLLKNYKDGQVITVTLTKDKSKIFVEYKGDLAGYVNAKSSGEYLGRKELEPYVKKGTTARVVGLDVHNFVIELNVSEDVQVNIETLDDVKKRLIKEKICTKKEIQLREDYLKKNGVTENQMRKLFSTYKTYDAENEKRIPQPLTLYQDSEGLVRKSVAYMNVGRHLLFEGERGTGKNVLTETLAWLYRRPLFEFSLNSQHDNTALLGGKTIESTVDEDGKETTTMGFDPEVIVTSAEVGGILVLDEFNTAFGHVLSVLNAYLDDRRRLEVPGYKTVNLDPNAMVIATQNRDYQSTFDNNEATIDRFVPIIFPSLQSIEAILYARVPGVEARVVDTCQDMYLRLKNAIVDGEISERTMSIRGFIDACLVVEQDIPLKDALIDNIAHRATDVDEREFIINMISALLG